MSVEPVPADESTQVEAPEVASPPYPEADSPRPSAPGGTPGGLGSERAAAGFTSEVDKPVQGIAEVLGNTGIDESEDRDQVGERPPA